MAITVVLALTAAMILALTLVPAAVSLFVTGRVDEKENRLMGWISRRYEPLLGKLLARPKPVVAGAVLLVVLAGLGAPRLGSEFIPQLDEGDIAMHALRLPGTSLSQSIEMQEASEARIPQFPQSPTAFATIRPHQLAN